MRPKPQPWLAAICVLAAGTAGAQLGLSRTEATQLYKAAGYRIVNAQPVNRCGKPAWPRVSFVDINGDQQPEALFTDDDPLCYRPTRRAFAVLVNDGGRWRAVIAGDGSIQAQATRTLGWLDMQVAAADCTRNYRYDGRRYVASGACADASVAAAPPVPPAAVPTKLSTQQTQAVFQAAGFTRRGRQWRHCDDPGTAGASAGEVGQVVDLNGDGRPEVVLVEGGSFCYGHTGQAYWLMSQRGDGRWQVLANGIGIVEVLPTRGSGGWADLSIGGPGLCFPVLRWNGREYQLQGWQYDGQPCQPPR